MLHQGIGFMLLTAIGGYWVLERSETHKGDLRQVGRLLGSIIVALSLLGVVCRFWCAIGGPSSCPFVGFARNAWQPRMHAPMPPPEEGRLPSEGRAPAEGRRQR